MIASRLHVHHVIYVRFETANKKHGKLENKKVNRQTSVKDKVVSELEKCTGFLVVIVKRFLMKLENKKIKWNSLLFSTENGICDFDACMFALNQ